MSAVGVGCYDRPGSVAVVAVAIRPMGLDVLGRWRLPLGEEESEARPYHVAATLDGEARRAVIDDAAVAMLAVAERGIQQLRTELGTAGQAIAGAAVPISARTVPDDLAAIVASHPLLHVADATLVRDAVCDALTRGGIAVSRFPERDTIATAARGLGTSAAALGIQLDAMRALLGAPWGKPQKLAAAAALIAVTTSPWRDQ